MLESVVAFGIGAEGIVRSTLRNPFVVDFVDFGVDFADFVDFGVDFGVDFVDFGVGFVDFVLGSSVGSVSVATHW